MDPKLSGLDPKLQDAYNRVMSGPTASPATGSAPASTTPASPSPTSSTPTPIPVTPSSPSISPPGQSTAPPSTPPPPSSSGSYSGFDTSASKGNNEGYSSASSHATPAMSAPQQAPDPTVSAAPTVTPTQPPVTPTTPSSTVTYNAQSPTTTPAQNGLGAVKKKGSGIMPVFAGILIVFMLAAYAILWIVVFEVDVPFLSDYI